MSWRWMRVPVMRCFGVVLPRQCSSSSSILGATVSMTGEGFGWLTILLGSETFRYLLTVLRLMPIFGGPLHGHSVLRRAPYGGLRAPDPSSTSFLQHSPGTSSPKATGL